MEYGVGSLADLGWLELLLLGLQTAELDWAISLCKEFSATLLRLALAASIYHLWLERNARVPGRGLRRLSFKSLKRI